MKNLLLSITILSCQLCFSQKAEQFSDSKNVIKASRFKIDIRQKKMAGKTVVSFVLFKISDKKWIEIQRDQFEKPEDFPLEVTTDEDLNHDGFNDIKISFAQAGRGSNALEKLFVYNPKLQKLVEIVNSQDYPNLHYNAKRNCITSYSFSGGNSTNFLKLNQNKLVEFARVDFYNDTASSYKIIDGENILIRKIPYPSDDAALFFRNFDPIEE